VKGSRRENSGGGAAGEGGIEDGEQLSGGAGAEGVRSGVVEGEEWGGG
jgi:hypothetical protein